jgi:hypothetical protein
MSIPAAALPTYERLRAEVLKGQSRPDGLAVVAHHGMLRGLAAILTDVPPPSGLGPQTPVTERLPLDREFLRLIANMVLQSQSEAMHVY